MLYIITDKEFDESGREWVYDVEAKYNISKLDILDRYENNEHSIKLLKEIEGMKSHSKDMIIAKFGAVALDNISTGGKTGLLVSLYDNIVVSTDEAGYNCIKQICEISKHKDVYITSCCAYAELPEISAYVNGKMCVGSDEIIDTMEVYYNE